MIDQLHSILSSVSKDRDLSKMVSKRDEVYSRYQPIFNLDAIDNLTQEEFLGFLLFKNNQHWTGLHRMGPAVTKDMDALRKSIKILIDDNVPITKRFDTLFTRDRPKLKKLGKAIVTSILMISSNGKYGVWNGTSEGALRKLEMWPKFERGTSLGHRYNIINNLLNEIAAELNIDLWTLDGLWWRVLQPKDNSILDIDDENRWMLEEADQQFGLERHLHEFILDNWEKTTLATHWELDENGGDIKGYGYERSTPVGRIDLLAKHKSEPRWLIIELKRSQGSDDTLGQVQRYMGWVIEELANDGDEVEGLIIASEQSEKLRYAMSATNNIKFMKYEVDFRLI